MAFLELYRLMKDLQSYVDSPFIRIVGAGLETRGYCVSLVSPDTHPIP